MQLEGNIVTWILIIAPIVIWYLTNWKWFIFSIALCFGIFYIQTHSLKQLYAKSTKVDLTWLDYCEVYMGQVFGEVLKDDLKKNLIKTSDKDDIVAVYCPCVLAKITQSDKYFKNPKEAFDYMGTSSQGTKDQQTCAKKAFKTKI